jgi:glycosyltransferase involved in cell wall biosynthesis
MKKIRILGCRGIPAAHGGFETFAEYLSPYLVSKGWQVTVYCQEDGNGAPWRDEWRGVERIHIPVRQQGAIGTMVFDWHATRDAAQHKALCLTLGYNTAIFTSLLRIRGLFNLISMDGIEWSRAKWSVPAKAWLWLNERAGCWLGNHLIADHPEIKKHLTTRVRADKITIITHGAERVEQAPDEPLKQWGLKPGNYLTLIARPEPENSVLEAVQGFSRKPRGMKLVILGNYSKSHPFQAKVLDAASDEVMFIGAIYDRAVVQALRFHCVAYIHGHQVGGVNPSLVEALGAGNAVIAHDNRFNRWVLGDHGLYFTDADSFETVVERVLAKPAALSEIRTCNILRHKEEFTWPHILTQCEDLLDRSWEDWSNSKNSSL